MALKYLTVVLVVSFTVIFAFISLAHADYHYASHEGNNEYPYTSWETAADSIQKAVDASSPHDTVYIGAGEWYEAVATGVYDSIAIIGMGIDSTFMFTDEHHVPVLIIDYECLVEGITFQHLDNWQCIWGRTFAGITVKNCKFNNSRIGIQFSGGTSAISNCVFDSCGTAINNSWTTDNIFISNNLILYSYDGWAIYLYADTALVQNNIVIMGPVSQVTGIKSVGFPDTVIIRNNVVVGGSGGITARANKEYNNVIKDAIHGIRYAMTAEYHDSLFNNSITNCYRALRVGDSCFFNYNNLWQNETIPSFDYFINPVGNIFCDPMFTAEDDVHLQAFSPLIDTGDPNYLDVDGTRSDIGCYGGPYGCSYTYLDLAPQIPDSITVDLDTSSVILDWPMNTEADFNRYQIYRDTVSGFEPTIFDIIAEPYTSFYIDSDIEPGVPYYYRLTSVDNQGNVSDYSDEVAVIPTYIPGFVDDGLPKYTVIESVYPNPSNSNVTIVYSASNLGPQPPLIQLKIFDLQGRVVKTLVDGRKPFGTHRIVWDGTNDNNQPVASGNYIAKVFQWYQDAGDFPVKITILK